MSRSKKKKYLVAHAPTIILFLFGFAFAGVLFESSVVSRISWATALLVGFWYIYNNSYFAKMDEELEELAAKTREERTIVITTTYTGTTYQDREHSITKVILGLDENDKPISEASFLIRPTSIPAEFLVSQIDYRFPNDLDKAYNFKVEADSLVLASEAIAQKGVEDLLHLTFLK